VRGSWRGGVSPRVGVPLVGATAVGVCGGGWVGARPTIPPRCFALLPDSASASCNSSRYAARPTLRAQSRLGEARRRLCSGSGAGGVGRAFSFSCVFERRPAGAPLFNGHPLRTSPASVTHAATPRSRARARWVARRSPVLLVLTFEVTATARSLRWSRGALLALLVEPVDGTLSSLRLLDSRPPRSLFLLVDVACAWGRTWGL